MPMMVQDKRSVPWNSTRTVEVRIQNRDLCGLVDRICVRPIYLKPNFHGVFAGHEREARYDTNGNLASLALHFPSVGFEDGVGRENPLSVVVIETQPNMKIRSGIRQVEMHFHLQPGTDRQALHHRLVISVQELQRLEVWTLTRNASAHAIELHPMTRPGLG